MAPGLEALPERLGVSVTPLLDGRGDTLCVTIPRRDVENLTLDELRTFLDAGAAESRTLDFKRDLSLAKDDSKREFLYDVTSFANSIGVDLVFGVDEHRDAAGKPLGQAGEGVGVQVPKVGALQLQMRWTPSSRRVPTLGCWDFDMPSSQPPTGRTSSWCGCRDPFRHDGDRSASSTRCQAHRQRCAHASKRDCR